ncbi:MAG TPA: hypothetical protein VII13_12935 [Vicinamibacteria bacterium]
MRARARRGGAASLAAALLLAGPAPAAELAADPRLRLEAARYVPADDPELEWSGWIGAGVALVRTEATAFDFLAEVETVLGEVVRPFEATQANYHLHLAVRQRLGAFEVGPYFHHVSRHAVDRPRPVSVDWNMLGLRVARAGERTLVVTEAGFATRSSTGYKGELAVALDADLGGGGHPYLRAALRYVIAEPSTDIPGLDRGDFVDVRVEAGPRWRSGSRSLALFAAYERRNDVLLTQALRLDRALFGFRVALEAREGTGARSPRAALVD